MNDSEIRRRELLRQTRRLYHEQGSIPAVHPRYGSIYRELYEEDAECGKSTFFYRLFLGILCFLCYVCMDYNHISVAEVNSRSIAKQIEKQTTFKDIQEVWLQK